MSEAASSQASTVGRLLDGRVHHEQPRLGHRTGIEPVLLAASIPARPGERVVEAGSGSGAALLCLAARVPGLDGLGLERDPAMAEMARRNVRANGAPVAIITVDVTDWRADGPFDHALANPPWHEPAGTPSPDSLQEAARRGADGLLAAWISRLAASLRHKGTLTLVLASAAVPSCLDAFKTAGCGGAVLFPLWPRDSRDAKLVLLRGVRGGRSAFRVASGLILHTPDGGFTEAANAILRDGAPLAF